MEEDTTSAKSVVKELGPFFNVSRADRAAIYRQRQSFGYFNSMFKLFKLKLQRLNQSAWLLKFTFCLEFGYFILPVLRIIEHNVCSLLVTEFGDNPDRKAPSLPVNPQVMAIKQAKKQLKDDLLLSLKASMCQKIETLMFQEVDRLHAEYEVKQKQLDEERSKMKRTETKQMFDFDQLSKNSGMGSVFGYNQTVCL